MIYFTRVESTLKVGCDVALTPRTLVVGPNGSGKSTIIQSLELATLGTVSDVESRDDVKQQQALARLFDDEENMFCAAVSNEGDVWSWRMEPGSKKGSYKTPTSDRPKRVNWLVQDLLGVLRGDQHKVRSWLESQVVGGFTEEQLLSAVAPSVRTEVQKLVKQTRLVDFTGLSQEARGRARRLRTEATQAENATERLTEGLRPPLLDSLRQNLEEEKRQLEVPTQPVDGITQEEYDRKRVALKARVEVLVKAKEHLAMATFPPEDLEVTQTVQKVMTAADLLRQHGVAFPGEKCWVCGQGDAAALTERASKYSAALQQLSPHIQAIRERRELDASINSEEARLKAEVVHLQSLKIVEPPKAIPARFSEITSTLAQDNVVRKTWANVEAMRKEIDQKRAQADLLSVAAKALDKAGKEYLGRRVEEFTERVNSFLPEGEVLGVDLHVGRVGLVRDGKLHSALSGAEENRVLMALACAQVATDSGSTPNLLIPRDRHWDRDTLRRVMEALSDSPAQVIIMSTDMPKSPVEGWSVVELR